MEIRTPRKPGTVNGPLPTVCCARSSECQKKSTWLVPLLVATTPHASFHHTNSVDATRLDPHTCTNLVIDFALVAGLVEGAWTGPACDEVPTRDVLAAVKAADVAEVYASAQRGGVLQDQEVMHAMGFHALTPNLNTPSLARGAVQWVSDTVTASRMWLMRIPLLEPSALRCHSRMQVWLK